MASCTDVREAVLEAFTLMDQGMPIQEALAHLSLPFPFRDRQLLSELTYGLVRTEDRLFAILEQFLSRRKDLPLPFLRIVALALYSLLFLSRIPPHAALNSAVESVKRRYGKSLAGLANALLRSFLQEKELFLTFGAYSRYSDPPVDRQMHTLARFYSLPFWLLRFWRESYGQGAMFMLARRSFERPLLGVLFSKKAHREIVLCSSALSSGTLCGFRLGTRGFAFDRIRSGSFPFDFSELHAAGLLSFQSPGSQIVLQKLGLTTWDVPVWDVCAGFGGKSAFLAEHGVPLAFCSDIAKKRLIGLKQDFMRRKIPLPGLFLADGRTPPLTTFDGNIILDVPCSGLGIIARRPDLRRNRKTRRSLRQFPTLQKELLLAALHYLRPGRELAYITCTLNPVENEERIYEVLNEDRRLRLECLWQTPHDSPFEGMFGARLRRLF